MGIVRVMSLTAQVLAGSIVTESSPPVTLSVVIPAWNEQEGIAAILDRVLAIREALPPAGVSKLELIVVDDGSSDRTAEIVESYQAVQLVRHPTNRGYGAALKTGFCHASGQLVGFLDADGTYPPERFPALCQFALSGAELELGPLALPGDWAGLIIGAVPAGLIVLIGFLIGARMLRGGRR